MMKEQMSVVVGNDHARCSLQMGLTVLLSTKPWSGEHYTNCI